MFRVRAAAAVCVLLSACSSTPTTPTAAEIPAVTPVATTAPATPAPVLESDAQKLQRIIRTLAEKSVYFDYDDYAIKPEYRDLLMQDFEFLKSAPKMAVTLEGNADERGSTEYNLALGQKRAESVKRALKLLGVPADQLEAVSFGNEKPRAECHEERCWADNRRVDIDARLR